MRRQFFGPMQNFNSSNADTNPHLLWLRRGSLDDRRWIGTCFAVHRYNVFPMLAELLLKWPLIRQLKNRADGTGEEAMSARTKHLRPKNKDAEVARSICPYCAVGCGQLVYHRDGKVINIEGDPQSPISRGHLCPKG